MIMIDRRRRTTTATLTPALPLFTTLLTTLRTLAVALLPLAVSVAISAAATLAFSALTASPVLANNGATLLFGDDPALIWAEWEMIRNGETPATAIYPISQAELTRRYDYSLYPDYPGYGLTEDLTPQGQGPSQDPSQSQSQTPPSFANRFGLTLRPVGGAYGLTMTTPFNRMADTFQPVANTMYWSMPPWVEIYDELTVGDWLYMKINIDMRFDAGKIAQNSGSIFPVYLSESSTPREGFITAGNGHFNITAGRMQSGIGYGYFGNTVLNGKANYFDQIQFTASSDKFKFFYLYGTSFPWLTPEEKTIQQTPWEFTAHDQYSDPYKTFTYHRLEYRPFPWLLIGAAEGNMLGGVKPDLQCLLPFNIWHNTYAYGYKNVMGSIDVSAVPFKGLHVFGEFMLDDYRLPREGGSQKPNAFAWQLGARYILPVGGNGNGDSGKSDSNGDNWRHMIGLEYTHVDPWTYNHFYPYQMFYQRQPYSSSIRDWYMDFCMGYTYGPDLDHYGIYYRTLSKSGVQASLSYFHMVQGEVELGACNDPDCTDATPHPWYSHNDDLQPVNGHIGTVEIYNTISLNLLWPFWRSFSVIASGSYSHVQNYNHIAGETGNLYTGLIGLQYRF